MLSLVKLHQYAVDCQVYIIIALAEVDRTGLEAKRQDDVTLVLKELLWIDGELNSK